LQKAGSRKVSELLLYTSDYRDIIDLNSRKLVFVDKAKGVVFFLVKPRCSVYVGSGAADIGIVGKDVLMETKDSAYEKMDLKVCRCRIVLAGLPGKRREAYSQKSRYQISENSIGIFNSKSESVEIIKLDGSIELAPIV
jgi:ATP phosphoribosyltransferase